MIDKLKVQEKFQKSLNSYDKEAFVQRKMAANLVQILKKIAGNKFDSVFEIGCGTGILTEMIVNEIEFENFTANDIVKQCENLVTKYHKKINFVFGDAEQREIIKGSQDLIISNAVFQWFDNMEKVYKNLHGKLNKNGIVAFTTFSPENLGEVRMLTGVGLDYLPLNKLKKLSSPYFHCLYQNTENISLFFKSPMKVLRHFKNTGVNSVCTKIMQGKELKTFINKYENQYGNEGSVSLTYTPITILLQKK